MVRFGLLLALALVGCSSSPSKMKNRSIDGFLEPLTDGGLDLSVPRPDGGGDAGERDASMRDASADVDMSATEDLAHVRPYSDGGLDPLLALPDPAAMSCAVPGDLSCPGYAECRFLTPTESRCDPATNGGGINTSCTHSS